MNCNHPTHKSFMNNDLKQTKVENETGNCLLNTIASHEIGLD